MGIKICNLCCGHGHVFEGWYRSDEELEADLEQIRLRGYSTEFDEFGVGISCIAVPILRGNGSLYGTVSIVASSSVVQEVAQQALPPMQDFAAFVREELL